MKSNLLITASLFLSLLLLTGCREPSPSGNKDSQQSETQNTESSTETKQSSNATKKYGDSVLRMIEAEFELLQNSASLQSEDKTKLEQYFQSQLGQISEWYKQNGPKIVAMRKEALAAAKRKDLRKLREMKKAGDKETIANLVNQEREILDSYRVNLERQIPVEAKQQWQATIVSNQLLDFLEPLKLSADQIEQVKTSASQAITRLAPKQRDNWRGYGTVKLEELFGFKIVEASQKQTFEDLKNKNKMRMMKWGQRF